MISIPFIPILLLLITTLGNKTTYYYDGGSTHKRRVVGLSMAAFCRFAIFCRQPNLPPLNSTSLIKTTNNFGRQNNLYYRSRTNMRCQLRYPFCRFAILCQQPTLRQLQATPGEAIPINTGIIGIVGII